MRGLIASAILSLALLAPAGAAETKPARPDWCRAGWQCITTQELADDAEYHYDLRERVLRYKTRARRFGLSAGPGIGMGAVVDENLGVHYMFVPGVYLIWGIRF